MKKEIIFGIILLCCLILLFGCTETKEKEETIKVGYLPLTDHMPIMIADAENMFGYDVELVKFNDWASLAEALSSGKLDGAHMLNTLGVKMVTNGFEGRTVVLSHRGTIALATTKAIETAQDLKGKIIAVPSHFSSHYFMLHNYLTQNNIDPNKDVTIIDIAPPDFVSTMASGRIDAFIGSEPFPTIAEEKDIGKVFKLWNEMEIEGLNGLDCVVVFNEKTILEKPEVVQDYVTAIIKAGLLIEEDPLRASELASPYLLNIEATLLERSINNPDERGIYDNLFPVATEYDILQNYMLSTGAIKETIDMDKFVDDSFARRAYGELGLIVPGE